MPLTEKGNEIKAAMEKEYGGEKGEQVFYASRNKGTISGVDSGIPETAEGIDKVEKAAKVEFPTAVTANGEVVNDGAEPKDETGDSYQPVTVSTLAEINERNRRYWEQQGGQFYENKGI